MKKVLIPIGIVAALLVLAVGMFSGSYNSLVSQREAVAASFNNIDVQLQRRADLIPNLVSTVQGFAAQEQSIIDSVTQARAQLAGAGTVQEKADADAALTGALGRLLVVVENYPELKSDANFRQLMDELAGTENRISVSRLDYNELARGYNTKVKSFPTLIFARIFGFEDVEYFEAAPGAAEVPEVTF
ncbi:LemA family protein [Anaerotalea alkaliphila]|uniref:LemA family protein n=1 Tax=Anaerotalea alkaliphila TaxID=2662126 RepID=A0A7X5KMY6_9FIRM|nr:LemA family protein [Anaerotalea alkaliphila]NDL68314.1 LemA family protein [Anaerotalea alkaliphila]